MTLTVPSEIQLNRLKQ